MTCQGQNPELDLESRSCTPLIFLLKHLKVYISCQMSNITYFILFSSHLYFIVVQGMKEAQERLTGDAFRKKHLEDEL